MDCCGREDARIEAPRGMRHQRSEPLGLNYKTLTCCNLLFRSELNSALSRLCFSFGRVNADGLQYLAPVTLFLRCSCNAGRAGAGLLEELQLTAGVTRTISSCQKSCHKPPFPRELLSNDVATGGGVLAQKTVVVFVFRIIIKGSIEGTSVLRQLIESQLSLRQMKRRNKHARKYARACGGSQESAKNVAPCVSPESWKLACSRRLVEARSERVRAVSDHARSAGPVARQRGGFAWIELRGRRSTFERSGADFVAGAALSQGQVFPRLELRGRRRTFERSGTNIVAGAALSKGQVRILWQAQHFRKVKCRIRGRRSTFDRSGTNIVAGAALSKGQVQISWLAQHFRKVKYRVRGRRSTFERSGTDFVTGAALSQGHAQNS